MNSEKEGRLPEKERVRNAADASTDSISLVAEGGRQGGEIIHQRIVIASTQSPSVREAVALPAHEARLLIPDGEPASGRIQKAAEIAAEKELNKEKPRNHNIAEIAPAVGTWTANDEGRMR